MVLYETDVYVCSLFKIKRKSPKNGSKIETKIENVHLIEKQNK